MKILSFSDHVVYARNSKNDIILVTTPERIEYVVFDYYSYVEVSLKTPDGGHDRTIYIRDAKPREKDAFKDWLLRNHFYGESLPDDYADSSIWKPDPDYYPEQEEK